MKAKTRKNSRSALVFTVKYTLDTSSFAHAEEFADLLAAQIKAVTKTLDACKKFAETEGCEAFQAFHEKAMKSLTAAHLNALGGLLQVGKRDGGETPEGYIAGIEEVPQDSHPE